MNLLDVTIPGEAPSTPNQRLHWATKARQTKSQRGSVARRLPSRDALPVVVQVLLTRIAPRRLDTDNLAAALKAHRDQVATWLRVDDASPLVRWLYAQEQGEPSVRIQVGLLPPRLPERVEQQEAPEPYRRASSRGVPTPNVRGPR